MTVHHLYTPECYIIRCISFCIHFFHYVYLYKLCRIRVKKEKWSVRKRAVCSHGNADDVKNVHNSTNTCTLLVFVCVVRIGSFYSIFSFRWIIIFLLMLILLFVLLFTASDYRFGISRLFLLMRKSSHTDNFLCRTVCRFIVGFVLLNL